MAMCRVNLLCSMGNRTVSSASTLAVASNACPDGNEVEWADTSAVAGRGRWATDLAAIVMIALSGKQANSNNAIRILRFASATIAASKPSGRSTTGPKIRDTPSQKRTHAGFFIPMSCAAFNNDQSKLCSQPQSWECPTHMTAYTAVATKASETARSACGRVML
ncbi:Uncharacterised protein [Mycobacterium tuberculosis]|nr:Uncharacterised protein [Mycobacterium tuberculosis]